MNFTLLLFPRFVTFAFIFFFSATKKFTVEIELMNIDRKFSNVVVYLGEIADVEYYFIH